MKKTIVFIFLISLCPAPPSWASEPEPIAILVNKLINVTNLSMGELAKIYKGQIVKWPDGQRIFVINRPLNSRIRARFYKVVLKSKPGKEFIMPDSPLPFKTLSSKSSFGARRLVYSIPNAIGYIYLSEIGDEDQVIRIDGALPGEKNYKLK
ncbi:MAG: substrate-binding domain-containing protein [Nitrospinales bacterium]